jgi:hypothetical protein
VGGALVDRRRPATWYRVGRICGFTPGPIPEGSDLWRLDGRVALVTGALAGLGARFAKVLVIDGGWTAV